MRFPKVFLIIVLLLIVVNGCSNQDKGLVQDRALNIFTTVYPLEYIIKEIAQETVSLNSVYPAGADGHTYEPTSRDMTKYAQADAFVFIGEGMESFSESVTTALKSQEVKLIEVGVEQGIFSLDPDLVDEKYYADFDPHIWFDPLRVIEVAEVLLENLINLNPAEETNYQDNFESLKSKLIKLDQAYQEVLAEKKNKILIVPHAAYNYWQEAYGIEQLAISGLSSGEEPTQKDLAELIRTAEKHGLKFVIFEQNSENRLAKIIQEELGAESAKLHNLEVRTEEDIANDKDYIKLMENNLEVLNEVLQ